MIKNTIINVVLFLSVLIVNGIFRKITPELQVIIAIFGSLISILIMCIAYGKYRKNDRKSKSPILIIAFLLILVYFVTQSTIGIAKVKNNRSKTTNEYRLKESEEEVARKAFEELEKELKQK